MFIIILHASATVMTYTDADGLLDGGDFPTTTEALIESHGDRTIDLPNGSETLGEALSRLEPETFETREDARLAVYSSLSRKAIGRFGYSDRDPTPLGSQYAPTQLSF